MRLLLGAAIGLGKGFTLSFAIPLEFKAFSIWHELPDGTAYEPPYNLLVGDDVLFGPGDSRFMAQLAGPIQGTPVLLSASVGVMLPTGRTASNPFTEVVSTQRQFRQFGNGTFDPAVDLAFVLGTKPIGMLVSGSARIPLYTNPKGYRGQFQLNGAAGLVLSTPRPVDTVRLLLLAEVGHSGAAQWDGERAENSGRDTAGVRLGFEWNMTPQLVLRGSLSATPIQVWQGEQFSMPWTAGIGVSGIIHLKKKKAAGQAPH
ncbi:MAG: hypothetical protein KDA24_27955 [Deltaproteobacteria bacterium]|nr:hypothetical protein [Deltaproteobacteria bacterium]